MCAIHVDDNTPPPTHTRCCHCDVSRLPCPAMNRCWALMPVAQRDGRCVTEKRLISPWNELNGRAYGTAASCVLTPDSLLNHPNHHHNHSQCHYNHLCVSLSFPPSLLAEWCVSCIGVSWIWGMSKTYFWSCAFPRSLFRHAICSESHVLFSFSKWSGIPQLFRVVAESLVQGRRGLIILRV